MENEPWEEISYLRSHVCTGTITSSQAAARSLSMNELPSDDDYDYARARL